MSRNGDRNRESDSLIVDSEKYGSVNPDRSLNYHYPRDYQHYFSAAIIVLVVLIGDTARGIMFPTLWPLISSLGGMKVHQGLAVAAFSAGRIVSSPIFGRYSETHGYRIVLIVCNILIMFGCVVYMSASSVWIVILGQWCTGFGAGSLGVTRSYVAAHTEKADRTLYMAYLTAVQYAGFTMTPMVGALLASYAQHNKSFSENSIISQYTLPALVLLIVAGMTAILLLTIFVDSPGINSSDASTRIATTGNSTAVAGGGDEEARRTGTGSTTLAPISESTSESGRSIDADTTIINATSLRGLSTADWMAIGGCLLNLSTKGTIGVYETLSVEFSGSHYNWTPHHAGVTVATWGTVGFCCLLSFKYFLQCFSDVNLVFYGMIVMTFSCLLLANLSPSGYVPEWMFYLSISTIYGLGYPVGHTALIGIFSKLMKAGPQGEMLGYFGSAGSLARVIFPIMAGILTDLYGDNLIFFIMAIVLFLSILCYGYYKPLITEMTK